MTRDITTSAWWSTRIATGNNGAKSPDYLNRIAALTSVFHIPQASGIPTSVQLTATAIQPDRADCGTAVVS